MGQVRGRPTPWWYKIPPVAVSLITLSVIGIALHLTVGVLVVSLGVGLAAGLLAALAHGVAQQAHDARHRPHH
ncbi:hypothetical protein ABZ626_37890 [Streptomyces longispororuber]|uniref:hypothetical protein n=1 Tax=Streptomyces longispororuber TaxID=68230 RepID=UPI0033D86846